MQVDLSMFKLLLVFLCFIAVFGKFCDSDEFTAAVEKADECMKTNDVCGCLKIEKEEIIKAACNAEPLKTFFKDGCLSFNCGEEICSF